MLGSDPAKTTLYVALAKTAAYRKAKTLQQLDMADDAARTVDTLRAAGFIVERPSWPVVIEAATVLAKDHPQREALLRFINAISFITSNPKEQP